MRGIRGGGLGIGSTHDPTFLLPVEHLAAFLPESVPARYPGWHAVIGELHFRLGRHSAAERAWREALRFTTARADREFLRRRLAVCRPDGGEPATE